MNIPVFHDDQHGTAIISGAALLNGAELQGKKLARPQDRRLGRGRGGHRVRRASTCSLGVPRGEHHDGRLDRRHLRGPQGGHEPVQGELRAAATTARARADAMRGADVFLGLSKAGMCTPEMLKTMAKNPIIFALANPDPEISYPDAKAARPDAIVATGRSDFPNQVNNVLGFPYIFRGALDVRATEINEAMKVAAAHALAALAHEPVPDSVCEAYGEQSFRFGPDYIIPKPFDTRVLWWFAPAVAKAAMESGVARLQIDLDEYRERLQRRIGGAQHTIMSRIVARAKSAPKRIVFPEGDNIKVLRACQIVLDEGIARPILLGDRAARSASAPRELDLDLDGVEIIHPADSPKRSELRARASSSCAAARASRTRTRRAS